MVRILLETRVNGLRRNSVKGRDLLYGLAAVLHRANSVYILIGELALTGGGRGRLLDLGNAVVRIDSGRRRKEQVGLVMGLGTNSARGSIGTLALAGDEIENTGRCKSQDVPEDCGLGGRIGPGATGGSE
jgi:hypothetical protein